MRVRILGCGPSSGVPRIGNDWGACDAGDPRNRRTRMSILIESGGKLLLVDCGPDLRGQLLAADIDAVNGVIVTHDHADHCHGIDDLRQIAANRGSPVPLYARHETLEQLRSRFGYAFQENELYRPVITATPICAEFRWSRVKLRFVDQPHGRITSLGIRADEDSQSFAYAVDFHDLTSDMAELYDGVGLWLCACTPQKEHPTHASLDKVLGWARELRVGQLLLTHLDKSMDYATLAAALPDWAAPAHDGQEISL